MNQIFNVSISKRDGSLTSADLTLPATPYQLADALEQLRADGAENVKAKISYCHSSGILNLLPTASGNLYEVNALAEKMAGFEDWQREAFDGMLKTDAFESSDPIPIARLIDFAYSTECCHVVGGITTDKELGEFLVENGLWGDEETLTEDVYKRLDFKMIGREHRLMEGGIFTANSYVEQHCDLIEAHRTLDLTPPSLDYTMLLKISKGFFDDPASDGDQAMTLKLPATEAQLSAVLEQLDVASWKEAGFACIDCKAPMLIDLINDAEDFDEVRQLADTLAEMPKKQLTEYKAILAATRCSEFDRAVNLIDRMEEYIVTPEYETLEDVARDEMSVIMSPDSVEIMLPYLDLQGYGHALVKALNADLTAYGMVERKDRQPVYAPPEQSQQGGPGMNL